MVARVRFVGPTARSALGVAVMIAVAGLPARSAPAQQPWIIDTHTHFKGAEQIALESQTTKRRSENTLGQVVHPDDYRELANRLGIQSTVVVEAIDQDQPQFNEWVLAQSESDLVCGYVARDDLRSGGFLERYHRYRKTGYLKGYRFRFDEMGGYLADPAARRHLKRLEQDGMVVDLLIDPRDADDVTQLARDFSEMKIVLNHCFRARMKDGEISERWKRAVRQCAQYPNVYCKLSSILNFAGTPAFAEPAPTDRQHYAPVLETCFEAFGEDRLIFATNWGVCTHFGKVDDVVRIASEFLKSKGEAAWKKGMRENALRVYRIAPRDLRQSGISAGR